MLIKFNTLTNEPFYSSENSSQFPQIY